MAYRPLTRMVREYGAVGIDPSDGEPDWRLLWAVVRPAPCGGCGRPIAVGERCTRGIGADGPTALVCSACRPWSRRRRFRGFHVGGYDEIPAFEPPPTPPAWTVIA